MAVLRSDDLAASRPSMSHHEVSTRAWPEETHQQRDDSEPSDTSPSLHEASAYRATMRYLSRTASRPNRANATMSLAAHEWIATLDRFRASSSRLCSAHPCEKIRLDCSGQSSSKLQMQRENRSSHGHYTICAATILTIRQTWQTFQYTYAVAMAISIDQ